MFAVVGVLVRPWKLPEAIWPVLACIALTLLSLISVANVGKAVLKGTDVYLFLLGMMLLADLARHEGLFDWLAGYAVQRARGSAAHLFGLVYLVGTLVTIFLSNDATAVVLTPAVYAAAKKANAPPLPYLFICAMIANAASFVLPISNPANLVVYGKHMPSLADWLVEFGLASIVSIVVTFWVLRFTQRAHLCAEISRDVTLPPLSRGGALAGGGIALTAFTLLVASSRGWQLGFPTFLAGVATAFAVLIVNRVSPWTIAKDISWSVLPLVAALFIVVEAVEETGVLDPLIHWLPTATMQAPHSTALAMGGSVAVLCNLLNNLPARFDRRHPRAQCESFTGTHRGNADWCGSWAQSIGDRITGDDFMAGRAATRKDIRQCVAVSRSGKHGDAAGADCIATGVRLAQASLMFCTFTAAAKM